MRFSFFSVFFRLIRKEKCAPFFVINKKKAQQSFLEQKDNISPLLRKKWLHFPNPKCFSTYSVAIRRVFRLMKKTSITVMKVATEFHRTSP